MTERRSDGRQTLHNPALFSSNPKIHKNYSSLLPKFNEGVTKKTHQGIALSLSLTHNLLPSRISRQFFDILNKYPLVALHCLNKNIEFHQKFLLPASVLFAFQKKLTKKNSNFIYLLIIAWFGISFRSFLYLKSFISYLHTKI